MTSTSATRLSISTAFDALATRRCIRRRRLGLAAVGVAAAVMAAAAALAFVAGSAEIPWIAPTIAALVLAGIFVDLAVRQHRTTRVLRSEPWVEVASRLRQIPMGVRAANAMSILELHGAPDDGIVLATPAGVRARPMADLAGRTWVVGDGRRFYVAAAGGSPIVRVKRLRLTRRTPDPTDVHNPLHSRTLPGR